jgi:hypothetical protein
MSALAETVVEQTTKPPGYAAIRMACMIARKR